MKLTDTERVALQTSIDAKAIRSFYEADFEARFTQRETVYMLERALFYSTLDDLTRGFFDASTFENTALVAETMQAISDAHDMLESLYIKLRKTT